MRDERRNVSDPFGTNCKLGPKADAQLHLVVADLLEGAE